MKYDGKHAKNSKFRLHFWPRIHFWRFGSPGYYYQLNWSTIAHLKSLVWTVFPASNPQDSLASEKSGAHTSMQSIRDQGLPSPAVRFLNPQDCRGRRQSSGYPIDLQWETEPAVNPMKDFQSKSHWFTERIIYLSLESQVVIQLMVAVSLCGWTMSCNFN